MPHLLKSVWVWPYGLKARRGCGTACVAEVPVLLGALQPKELGLLE